MGTRGLWATPPPKERPPFRITAESIALYRFMRELEKSCHCADEECQHWDEWWEANARLAAALGLFTWELAFVDPKWRWPRTRQVEIDRFHALEAAASKVKKQKFRYKWQRQ